MTESGADAGYRVPRPRSSRFALVGGLLLALSGATWPPAAARASDLVLAEHGMVAADNLVASEVGVEVMRAGGNTADAAVAVGLTLGVVNPFASGIGGGGFVVFRDGETGDVFVLDFRETAPAAAHRDMFVIDGQHDPDASVYGGLAVAVPGEAAGWWALHQRFGRLPWHDVVEPARRLAADGFRAGPLLEERLRTDARLSEFSPLVAEFTVADELAVEGDLIVRSRLGEALGRYQDDGPAGFYEGPTANDIADTVRSAGGVVTLEDLGGYAVRWRDPIVSEYRGHTIYGVPAPSSGGIVIAQTLRVLEHFALDRLSFDDPITAHIVMQAFAHLFADRASELGDDAYWDVPVDHLLGDERRDQILDAYRPTRTLDVTDYGRLVGTPDDHGTSHFSVVDPAGDAVACTVTINTGFGSHLIGAETGIVLNNEMDDFASQPGVPNAYGLVGSEANAVAPGKRPLSSMSPTIVVRDDALVGVLGGSGGPLIITETLLGLIRMIDFDSDASAAVSGPRFHHQWQPFVAFVEEHPAARWADGLAGFGYAVQERPLGSALQIIWEHADGWQAASDPRKLGAPAGY